MKTLKPEGVDINFDGINRKFLFNINVVYDIQEHFDTSIEEVIQNIYNKKDKNSKYDYKLLAYVAVALSNEDTRIFNKTSAVKREMIDEEYITTKIPYLSIRKIVDAVFKAYMTSNKTDVEENDDPNVKSE